MKDVQNYIQENKNRFIQELIDLLKIPSISADKNYEKQVLQTADQVKVALEKAGCDKVEMCETPGYPIVYGEKNNRCLTSNSISLWSL
jgi:acetylornithine deacetylase/succinyl-diaminopimelate desuccinylase-like protein